MNQWLELRKITKIFPGVRALDQVSLTLNKGEVHALCGENGAGKSTLMNILSGNLQPDEGSIYIEGSPVSIPDPAAAMRLGIGIVHQERSLVENLSIAENIYANHSPKTRWGLIDYPALYEQTTTLLHDLQLGTLDPRTLVSRLSPALQQMIEIAKALSQKPSMLILDEPTASITEKETSTLFQIIQILKKEEVGIIYISHRMAEIFEIADRVTILKDGTWQGTKQVKETSVNEIIKMMVGRDLKAYHYQDYRQNEVLLEVRELSGDGFRDISFRVKKGEILGLAGLVGAGRSELARAIIGADKYRSGSIYVEGKLTRIKHPAEAMNNRIVYLPEHRKEQGLFLEMSITENITVTYLPQISRGPLLQFANMRREALSYIKLLDIRAYSEKQSVIQLSGGNQQKIVLAKCLALNPKIFIVDEPTHGIDVGAKSEIYDMLRNLAKQGMAIILISSELPELLSLSDRVLVMHMGCITGEFDRLEASEERIMHYASGTANMFAG